MYANAYSEKDMPAKSKSQQRLMAMALLYKTGKIKNVNATIKKVGDSMSVKQLKKFAKTEHSKLKETKEKTSEKSTELNESRIRQMVSRRIKKLFTESTKQEDDRPVYTDEQKRRFTESIKKFNKFGESIYRDDNVLEAYKQIKELVEFAVNNLAEDAAEWFDDVTATRHAKRLKESFKVFEKSIQEVSKLQRRAEAAFDDIGETLSKYYKIESSKPVNESAQVRLKEEDIKSFLTKFVSILDKKLGARPLTLDAVTLTKEVSHLISSLLAKDIPNTDRRMKSSNEAAALYVQYRKNKKLTRDELVNQLAQHPVFGKL